MKPKRHLLTTFSVLLIAALMVGCVSPAVAPPAPPVSPTATSIPPTPTPVPPAPEPTPVAAAPDSAAAPEPSPPHGMRFDAPKYAIDGPYAVGVRYFTIPAKTENDRDLTVSVWYPAQKSASAAAKIVYEQQFAPGEIPAFSVFGQAQLDAPPDLNGAPYPLVVYSHATWSSGQEVPYLTEHLASRGFVVISADHEDNWSTAFAPAPSQAMIRRPQEVTREIDYAESLAAPDGDLPGMIDTTGVGVAGWSMGGQTALAVAGARWDLNGLRVWCADDAELSVEACVENFTALTGLEETPQGLWPSMVDERVRAVIPLSGYTTPFGSDGVQSVDVPVMFMVGSGAVAADRTFDVDVPYENISAERKAKVVFDYGEALMFFSSCVDSPTIVELGFPMFCTDPVWDMDRAHDLVNHFATAFLLAELKGDAEAAKALAPENVEFPGIKYESAAYGTAPTAKLDAATVAKIETLVKETVAKSKVPGAAVGIVKNGELVYAKGFGVSNLDGGAPVTPQTMFQWAETSMAPTAMAVLQLVEQGKIDLDAPVTAYLPYFKLADERYKDITVGQILMHRSGIPDSGDAMADWENFMPQYDPGATERWVRSLADKGLLFAPGSGFEYSDLGYALLGDVIAKVSGQSYEETMSENILKPLGMNNSAFLLEEVDKALLAAPHVINAAGEVVAGKAVPYHRPFAAANNLFSSIEDMAKLAQASLNRGVLNGQRILPESAVEQMWTSHTPTSYGDFRFGTAQPARMMIDWGYGWFLGDVAGHRVPNTFGREYGIQSAMALAPDANPAVIAVGNGPVTGAYYASDTATDVMGMLLDIEPKKELTAKLDDATVATIETLVREIMAKGKVPGAVVGVVKDGELVYASGFGVGKLGTDEPVTPDSVFPMGSVAKTPVAMAIMQLVAEGKIDLDAPVTKYLPYFTLADPDAGAITIRQLLSHTSGLPDTIDWLAEYQDKNKRIDEGVLDDYVRSLSKESLLFRPGKEWAYSSIGFDILGDVVAKVSGQNFEDYVQDHVLTPLGLEDSSYLLSDVNPTALVAPHMYDEQGNAKTLDFFPYSRTHAPSGAFYASVNDMARFAVANLNHGELNGTRVLPASAYDEMWAPQAASTWAEAFGPQVTNYGLGWWVGEFNGHRIIGNYGTEFGFQSHLGLFPDKGLAVIALVNLFDPEAGSFYAYDMGNGIAEALLGVEAKPTTQP